MIADDSDENDAKSFPNNAVDDEIDARVESQTQVADSVDEQETVSRKRNVEQDGHGLPGSEQQVGQFTDDEHNDDNDEGQRISFPASLHPRVIPFWSSQPVYLSRCRSVVRFCLSAKPPTRE